MDLRALPTRRRFFVAATAAGTLCRLDNSAGAAAASSRNGYRVFSEGRIAGLRLKNRLVRSATAENAWRDGAITEEGVSLYRDLAAGGVGLIMTGHMGVMPQGRANDFQTCIDDDRFIGSLRKIAAVVHATSKDCKVAAQLAHAGMQGQATERVGPTERMRLFPLSAMYRLPAASTATPLGSFNEAAAAGPPSPEYPQTPFPATTRSIPDGRTLTTKQLLASVA